MNNKIVIAAFAALSVLGIFLGYWYGDKRGFDRGFFMKEEMDKGVKSSLEQALILKEEGNLRLTQIEAPSRYAGVVDSLSGEKITVISGFTSSSPMNLTLELAGVSIVKLASGKETQATKKDLKQGSYIEVVPQAKDPTKIEKIVIF